MISNSSARSASVRMLRLLAIFALASATSACDSSSSTHSSMPAQKVLSEPLPPEKLEKWVGEGATKHKEAISREERLRLIHDAAKKSD